MADAKEQFVIDTCSILDIKRKILEPHRKTVYGKLSKCVQQKTLYFPDEVYKELRNGASKGSADLSYAWAKTNRAIATSYGDLTEDTYALLEKYPPISRIIDPEKGSAIEADPYILALAMKMKNSGYSPIVITEESKSSPIKLALPQACGILRLPCMGVFTYLEQEGLYSPGS